MLYAVNACLWYLSSYGCLCAWSGMLISSSVSELDVKMLLQLLFSFIELPFMCMDITALETLRLAMCMCACVCVRVNV